MDKSSLEDKMKTLRRIRELLDNIDIVELIYTRIPLRKRNKNNYIALCPFHEEKTPSFIVNGKDQYYYCFGCGKHGNAIDFIAEFKDINFEQSVDFLIKNLGNDMYGREEEMDSISNQG